jgi:hypothetical protein
MAALMLTGGYVIENDEGQLRAHNTTRLITIAGKLYRVQASYSYMMRVILAYRHRTRLVARTGSGQGSGGDVSMEESG